MVGKGLTSASGVSFRENRCAMVVSSRIDSIMANELPMQILGPPPNGNQA